jgi:4-amino-4-deoxychorismate lyase
VSRILVNGKETDSLSALDRGLQYGDGLFETLALKGGQPVYWERHMARLMRGCQRLAIPLPDTEQLAAEARRLGEGWEAGVLKIMVTRGGGGRGYGIPTTQHPTRILALFPVPDYPAANWTQGVAVRVCATRLGLNPALAGLKHLNRLEQVLARGEWQDDTIAEGLMRDVEGRVIEGTMTNVFAVRDGRLLTPELTRCGVAGVMREVVLERAPTLGITSDVTPLEMDDLLHSQELFLSNSLIGIWPVRQLGERVFPVGTVTRRLAEALEAGHA